MNNLLAITLWSIKGLFAREQESILKALRSVCVFVSITFHACTLVCVCGEDVKAHHSAWVSMSQMCKSTRPLCQTVHPSMRWIWFLNGLGALWQVLLNDWGRVYVCATAVYWFMRSETRVMIRVLYSLFFLSLLSFFSCLLCFLVEPLGQIWLTHNLMLFGP